MSEKDVWSLFLETGLPQAYTYLKERERQKPRPGRTAAHGHRSGECRAEI